MYKKSYFQGTEEPTPHKKKYKSEKAILVQPRFEEPFYRNYDIYGDDKLGPGSGWHSIQKYKSIADFRKAKRKRLKDKYKANDSWIEDTFSNRKDRINKMKVRAEIFNYMIKTAIDFAIDDQINSGSIIGDSGTYSDSVQIGGQLDEYLPQPDLDGKLPNELNFGRDYVSDDKLEMLTDKYLKPAEPSLYGLPDGIDVKEDLDMPSPEQPQYGTTDSGNTFYNEMWI